jgi:DNA-binding NarL/FixJ family response regulator
MLEKIKIGLVDDQRLFRQSLATFISTIPSFDLVLEAENGADCLEQIATQKTQLDVMLMDMEMPGMNGIELNEQLQKKYPHIKVLVLSMYNREKQISRMIQAGASGYLEKNCESAELVKAIESVHTSGFYMNATVLSAMQKKASSRNQHAQRMATAIELTSREAEVLKLICKECSNAEIAEQLFISIRTAEGHRTNLLLKTGSRNTAGLVLFAIKFGYCDLIF